MTNNDCDYLIIDSTNILYRTFFAHKQDDDVTVAGMATHIALTTLNKYFKGFKPRKKIIMCFDRPNCWRKIYTRSEDCISKKLYKGNRRQKMTPKEKEKFERFLEHITEFEALIREHTAIVALAGEGLEADDLIAGAVQVLDDGENDFVIVSADKDMIQLLDYPNVRLINPADGKDRTLNEWEGSADLFMFEKCIRGDLGDNVQSAFPRCRKTRIVKAFKDNYERENLMHETWKTPDGDTMEVGKLFKENELLMDLASQPRDIQKQMFTIILKEMENPGTFSYFHFMKFLGKYDLKRIAEQAELFTNMLSCKPPAPALYSL